VAREWHASNQRWSADHAARVMHYLEVYLFPSLGDRDITELKIRDLLGPLKAVEATGKLDVASRLQQRVTGVMRYAMQNGLIDYNPAQDLVGAIATRKAKHYPALPLEQLPDFLECLEDYGGRKLTRLAVQLALVIFIRCQRRFKTNTVRAAGRFGCHKVGYSIIRRGVSPWLHRTSAS
jgi:integrase